MGQQHLPLQSESESRFWNTSWGLKTRVELSLPPASPAPNSTQVFATMKCLKVSSRGNLDGGFMHSTYALKPQTALLL